MKTLTLILLLCLALTVMAHDYVPAPPQDHPILLKGGTAFTITDGTLEDTDVLFDNGRIAAIGRDLTPPDGCEIIDVAGKHVYPTMVATGTSLGLTEIGAVRATNDAREVGRINPDVQTRMAYNPDSEIIPTTRSNGVGYAQIMPGGSLLQGRSCLVNLDAWTQEDAVEVSEVALHLAWPAVTISTGWWEERSAEEQKKDMIKNREAIGRTFDDAHAYYLARKANPNIEIDSRWEAMVPVFDRELPVWVHANDYRQIEQAIAFSRRYGFRMVLLGGCDAALAIDLLKENSIPVVYGYSTALPNRSDNDYDQAFIVPRLLYDAGIPFCIGKFSATAVRNIAFDAGMAEGFGLDHDIALRSVTLSAAEIMGAESEIGSLEVGKKASIVVSDGDLLDFLTHHVTMMFIEGRKVDLDDKHKELYRKYRDRKGPGAGSGN
ncbi:MAG: amidohydrolase family protein [candidate division Zixibacteria bacterium]|nr:amidohydrolase family protein [candidate division Zixibacteria bacterium]